MARYDGQTEWYDELASTDPFVALRRHAVALLGPPRGACLDVGCGTGLGLPLLAEAGWDATGVEVSEEQLARARERGGRVVQGDAHALPFDDASFDAVISMFTHTDFDDARTAFAECARVLRPGGVFVYAGVHPCFAYPGAHPLDDGTTLLEPGYRATGWQTISREPDHPGIRSRVGINHVPLAGLVNAIIDAGLVLTRLDEPREEDPPKTIALRATRA